MRPPGVQRESTVWLALGSSCTPTPVNSEASEGRLPGALLARSGTACHMWKVVHLLLLARCCVVAEPPCLLLEGRASSGTPINGGCATVGEAATLSVRRAACPMFYQIDDDGTYRPCHFDEMERVCVATGQALACSLEASANRSQATLIELRRHAMVLRRMGVDSAREDASEVTATVFARAIVQDAQTPLALSVRVLETALERASGFGWIDPAHSVEQVARQLTYDEAWGVEAVLAAAVDEASRERARVSSLAVGRRSRPPRTRLRLGVARGYFTNDGEPYLLSGYNALDHHLSIVPDNQIGLLGGGDHSIPRQWQRTLDSLGVNVISYQLPLARLLDEKMQLVEAEVLLVGYHLDWAATNNISMVLHLSHGVQSRPWASLGTRSPTRRNAPPTSTHPHLDAHAHAHFYAYAHTW